MKSITQHPLFATVDGELIVVPYGIFGGMYHADPAVSDAIIARFRSWFYSAIVPGMVYPATKAALGNDVALLLTVIAGIAMLWLWAFMVKALVADLEPVAGRPPWLAFLAAGARQTPLPRQILAMLFGFGSLCLGIVDSTSWHAFSAGEQLLFIAFGGFFFLWMLFLIVAKFIDFGRRHTPDNR